MLNMQKIKAMKRIREEYIPLITKPLCNIGAVVCLLDEDNIFKWTCSLIGPKNTSYQGGLFFFGN